MVLQHQTVARDFKSSSRNATGVIKMQWIYKLLSSSWCILDLPWICFRFVRYRFARYRFVKCRLRFVSYKYIFLPRKYFDGLQDVFQVCLEDVLTSSWKTKNCFAEDVSKTSRRPANVCWTAICVFNVHYFWTTKPKFGSIWKSCTCASVDTFYWYLFQLIVLVKPDFNCCCNFV